MIKWNNKVKRILKSELIKRGVSTENLTILLNKNGCTETKSSVDSKISRGTFSASFFIQCLYVIGCTKIEIEDIHSSIRISELPITSPTNFIVAEANDEYKIIKDDN
jgi:hypothetical protein